MSDHPLIDDWWEKLWKRSRQNLDVVVIVDSCHSQSIGIGALTLPPRVDFFEEDTGPRRLFISASLDYERAAQLSFGSSVQGVLTRELQLSWSAAINRTTYRDWFDYAARGVNRTIEQNAVMTIVAPDRGIETARPF